MIVLERFARLMRGSVSRALAWTLLVVLTAVAINVAGIHAVGDARSWQRWLHVHRLMCLLWRLCLYTGIGCVWWRVRRQLRARGIPDEADRRLRRAEIAAVVAAVLLECSTWLKQG